MIQIRKVHPRESKCSGRFLVQRDKLIQTKGTMNQVFNQIRHCCHQSVVDVFATKDESQASYVGLLSGLGKQMLEHLL